MGELKDLCIRLKDCGLTGIESMYSTYKGFDELTVRKLAHETGLLESGGSDFTVQTNLTSVSEQEWAIL